MRRLMEGGFVSRSWLEDALLLAVLETGVPGVGAATPSASTGRSDPRGRARPSAWGRASSRPTCARAAWSSPTPRRRVAGLFDDGVAPSHAPAPAHHEPAACSPWPSTACPICTSRRRCVTCVDALGGGLRRWVDSPGWSTSRSDPRRPRPVAPARGADVPSAPRGASCARQIAALEAQLSEALVTAFPHGRDRHAVRRVPGRRPAPPRGSASSRRVRDALADRVAGARAELEARGARAGAQRASRWRRCCSSRAATSSPASARPSSARAAAASGRCARGWASSACSPAGGTSSCPPAVR